MGYKWEKPEFQIRSLTTEEFERLISTPIKSTSQCFIRDLFVFAAFTGLSFIDLKQLTWKDIVTEEDGSLWISMSRQKTDAPFNVKLLDIPIQIIEKYKGLTKDNHVFSMLSIGRITLSQMMGHLSIKTTQIYAEVTRTKINEDMTNLAETIQGKYELPENDGKIYKTGRRGETDDFLKGKSCKEEANQLRFASSYIILPPNF